MLDFIIVMLGGIIFQRCGRNDLWSDHHILLTYVIDKKVMYGIDAGKMTLIVTDRGNWWQRKSTNISDAARQLLKAEGSHKSG